MNNDAPSYHGYRYPAEIISHAVWLYHRFCLSFRDVEDLWRCCMNRLQDETRPLRLPSGRDRLGPRLPELEHPVENPASDHRLPSLSLEVLRP